MPLICSKMLQNCLFRPSCCKICSIDLKFGMENIQEVIWLYTKFQDPRLSISLVLCYRYAVKCCKNAFFRPSGGKNCSMDLKFGMDTL